MENIQDLNKTFMCLLIKKQYQWLRHFRSDIDRISIILISLGVTLHSNTFNQTCGTYHDILTSLIKCQMNSLN